MNEKKVDGEKNITSVGIEPLNWKIIIKIINKCKKISKEAKSDNYCYRQVARATTFAIVNLQER